jgi:hypothetical protein
MGKGYVRVAPPSAEAAIGVVGLGERQLGSQRQESVKTGIETVDPIQARLGELARRELARTEGRGRFEEGEISRVGH